MAIYGTPDYDNWLNSYLNPHEINHTDSFVCGWYSYQNELIDAIDIWFDSEEKREGLVGDPSGIGDGSVVNKEFKDSIEASFQKSPLLQPYLDKILKPCLDSYLMKFPYAANAPVFSPTVEGINLQEYKAGSNGYPRWHAENSSIANRSRHLVFMTYLNDVTDGGETEFYHQRIKVKPEKGLTLIFPADWTHTHCGRGSKTQDKRFITGWFTYVYG
jgi:hypothetical protein